MVRVKYRYVVVQIETPDKNPDTNVSINDGALYSCITKHVQKHYGDHGLASVRFGLKCKYVNEKTRIAILRIKHLLHRFVTSILPLISLLGNHKVKFRILYNGATIMQCNKFIVDFQKTYLDECVRDIKSLNQKNILMKNLMNISTVSR